MAHLIDASSGSLPALAVRQPLDRVVRAPRRHRLTRRAGTILRFTKRYFRFRTLRWI
jgi:hypothetical protein